MDGFGIDMEQHIKTQLESFDEIMSNAATCFYEPVELARITEALMLWKKYGFEIVPQAAAWLAVRATEDQKNEFFAQSLVAGWFPFLASKRSGEVFEYRLIKLENGRSIFGKTKYSFRFYRSEPSGRFVFVSEHSSTKKAMRALSRMMIES